MTDLAPRLVRPQDLKIKLLVYGMPGVGKTMLASTAMDHPALSPALFLNFEGGLLSVAGRGDIEAVDIGNMHDLEQVYLGLRNQEPPWDRYQTVVIDSGSELQSLSLREIVQQAVSKERGRNRNTERTEDDIHLDDYGRANVQMGRVFSAFRDLPTNLIVTSLARFHYPMGVDRRKADPVEVLPHFAGQLTNKVMAYMDFVHYLYVDDEETRWLLTRSHGPFRAKTRAPRFAEALGMRYKNPTMPALYDLLIESEGSTSASPSEWHAIANGQAGLELAASKGEEEPEEQEEQHEEQSTEIGSMAIP